MREEVIEYRPDNINCPECGNKMIEIEKEVHRTLVLVRKHFKVREGHFYKYTSKVSDKTGTHTPVTGPKKLQH